MIAWSLETGNIKRTLHDQDDKTCVEEGYASANHEQMIEGIKKSKSVDKLIIMEKKELLLSMTCDQWLRFWVLDDLKETKTPCFRFNANHPNEEDRNEENLTAIAVSEDCDAIITGDTSGQMKMWDVSKVDFEDQRTEKFFIEKYFILAHKKCINDI